MSSHHPKEATTMKTKVLRPDAHVLGEVLPPAAAERQVRTAIDFNLQSLRQALQNPFLETADLAEIAHGIADLVTKVADR
jgi:hypothetical protein